jgi:hypothetical protein
MSEIATTWVLDAGAAVADAVAPTAIDPAVVSARIAGTMMVRLMVMIPPWRLRRSAACFMASAAHEAHLSYSGAITGFGYYMT